MYSEGWERGGRECEKRAPHEQRMYHTTNTKYFWSIDHSSGSDYQSLHRTLSPALLATLEAPSAVLLYTFLIFSVSGVTLFDTLSPLLCRFTYFFGGGGA